MAWPASRGYYEGGEYLKEPKLGLEEVGLFSEGRNDENKLQKNLGVGGGGEVGAGPLNEGLADLLGFYKFEEAEVGTGADF